MNMEQVKGKWKQFTGSVQERWGELTNDEIEKIEGEREQLEGKIQERYGKSKEEAREEVNEWLDSLDD